MNVFLSCVSTEFKSYRLRLANQLGALKDRPYEIKVQEDFQQGPHTLLEKLADYIRECDLVIHLAGDARGAGPTAEHVQAILHSLGDVSSEPGPDWSYTQWEYRLALRFNRKMLVYLAAAEAPRDCVLPVQQSEPATESQQSHINAIRISGKHYGVFAAYNTLLKDVFHDLGLELERKINNLPFKSLGSLFKGRDDLLKRIHQELGSVEYHGFERSSTISAPSTALALYGLGGSGKTRVAIEYAQRYSDEYTGLLFVLADSARGLQENVAALCGDAALDLPEKDQREIDLQFNATVQWLQQHAGWLLILDNVDTEEAAQGATELLGRLASSGQVLVTSRLSNWPGAVKSLSVDLLAESDAIQFLLERTEARRRREPDENEQARKVAMELGLLALALEQASAYIEKYRCTFTQYLSDWRERHDKVLEWFDARLMQYPMSVAVTWQTSFDSLSEQARRLLRMLAWLAPDPIPEALLDVRGGPFAFEQQDTPLDPREALAGLDAHSLITRSDTAATFSVHRLVQDVTRRSSLDSDHRALRAAVRWLKAAFDGDPQDVRKWPILAPLAPHALAATQFAEAAPIEEPLAILTNQLAVFYRARAHHAEAERQMKRALTIAEQVYGLDHPALAIRLNNLAAFMQDSNRLRESEALYLRALSIDDAFFGPDHPEVAADLNNLAQLMRATNRASDSEPLMRRAVAIFERLPDPNDPRLAASLDNLATLLSDTNRLDEAEPLYRRALTINQNVYGPDDPAVATNLGNLAGLLRLTNRTAEAEPLYRRALSISESAYGSDHPAVATDLNNLAGLLSEMKRFMEAEALYRRALAIDEQVYGPDSPAAAGNLNNLAHLLRETNRVNEAEPLMRRALEIVWKFTRDNGYEHPHLRSALESYARLLVEAGYSTEQAIAKLQTIVPAPIR